MAPFDSSPSLSFSLLSFPKLRMKVCGHTHRFDETLNQVTTTARVYDFSYPRKHQMRLKNGYFKQTRSYIIEDKNAVF